MRAEGWRDSGRDVHRGIRRSPLSKRDRTRRVGNRRMDFVTRVRLRAFSEQYSVGIGRCGGNRRFEPASSAIPAAAEPEWLRRVNYYRAMVKLPPIVEDPALSKGDRAHTIYVVKNYHDAIEQRRPRRRDAYRGSGESRLYARRTRSGQVQRHGCVVHARRIQRRERDHGPDEWGSPPWSIDGWMAIPFHRMPILNPRLTSAGFGIYCEVGSVRRGTQPVEGLAAEIAGGRGGELADRVSS